MSPIETKRTAAIKVADALNSIEGVPVSAFAKDLSAKWAKAQIVQMVKAVHLDGAQLAAFLSAYASGEIALPQPDADYTDEQEETEDEA